MRRKHRVTMRWMRLLTTTAVLGLGLASPGDVPSDLLLQAALVGKWDGVISGASAPRAFEVGVPL
jgi:hypothetical protein